VTWVLWNLVSVRFEIVLVLVHDRFTVWTHLMVNLGDEAQVEAHFGLIRNSSNLDAT
jgi:hypothetical protein